MYFFLEKGGLILYPAALKKGPHIPTMSYIGSTKPQSPIKSQNLGKNLLYIGEVEVQSCNHFCNEI